MLKLLMLAAGGAIGALLRFGVGTGVQRVTGDTFPTGTLVVNVLGCLAIGVIGGWLSGQLAIREEYRLFVVIGLLGSFTTFSTFGWEMLEMLQHKQILRGGIYLVLSNVLGIAGVWLGVQIAAAMAGSVEA